MADEQRATIFGGEAERYDRYRPGYPAAAIDAVVEHRPTTAVDAGCGTGKAASLVAQRGVDVIGVEPDDRMARLARRRGITVTVSTLENWDIVECDVMYAAQAWHWIDPNQGAAIAAASIRSGGRWAALWNYEIDERFAATCLDVYRRLAPDLLDMRSANRDDELRDAITAGLASTTCFDELVVDEVTWADQLSVETAVQRLASHSAHRLLEPAQSDAVNEALGHELGDPHDIIGLDYVTRIYTAERR